MGSSSAAGGLVGHSQLARSLERILEEAHFSGELILTNRKLKDFPKTGTKFNLTDTVIADLSRNRFCELPEEITTFAFLETLLLYHNTIRSIPESVKQLTSLTYLDLRSNQLGALPRELCFLPLQVLLVSNNRLVSLPDELGRMDRLTDLDASYNQLTALPARIGELRSLRAFSLRSNQLVYLPRELTCLNLVTLDVSNNRIAGLPLEIRQMSTLVEFNLENNPLTSPPASLCVRGLVHVFKFLETQATKDEKGVRSGGNYDGYTTLRRAPRHNSAGNMLETVTLPRSRHHIESGFNTCDGHDKRWSHDVPIKAKASDSPIHRPTPTMTPTLSVEMMDASLTSSTSTIVDDSGTLSGSPALVKPLQQRACDSPVYSPSLKQRHDVQLHYAHSTSSSNGSSPDQEDLMIDHQERNAVHCNGGGKVGDEKLNKSLSNIQTYKEYKEALKQQRNQEITNVYKQKHANANLSPGEAGSGGEEHLRLNGVGAPPLPTTLPKSIMKHTNHHVNGHNSATANTNGNGGVSIADDVVIPKKPIQKVIPSRNTELMASLATKTHSNLEQQQANGDCLGYVKPSSPMKSAVNANGAGAGAAGVLANANNNKFNGVTPTGGIKSPVGSGSKLSTVKTHRTVTWNHDIPAEKLSFTMRREFDRQREETELMTQLRSIIETRLKMSLPEDIASALTDGVILCHLANYVRPRSVASIHVPSPGVSKLTMARCRRNVDNFLEACRRIGVDEELICSCADVVPQIDDDDDDNNGEHIDASDVNSNNNFGYDNNATEGKMKRTKTLPNQLAVLQTVAALIAMDANPHHQSIRYMQQLQDLQEKLQHHRRQQEAPQQHQQQQQQHDHLHHQTASEGGVRAAFGREERCVDRVDAHNFKQEQLTAPTCTKQQMLQQQQQQQQPSQANNYEIVTKMEIENRSDSFHTKTYFENIITTTNGRHADVAARDSEDTAASERQRSEFDADEPARSKQSTVTQLIRTAKLKTFQKIKLNLLTSHGHHNFVNNNNRSHCDEATTTLHTIVESEHDVVSAGPAGHYQLINEKAMEDALPSYGTTAMTPAKKPASKSTTAQEPPPLTTTMAEERSQPTAALNISKRIEFFEHNPTPAAATAGGAAGGTIATSKVDTKPSTGSGGGVGIFSIYRNNGTAGGQATNDMKLVDKAQLCAMMLKGREKEQEAGTSLLRHDSHTLTIALSCVFIVTFLLLVFFPLPG